MLIVRMASPATTQAAEAASIDRLNDDTVAEILLRLPSTSVLRSRAVCRAWRRITTTPVFLAAHSRHRPLELIIDTYRCKHYTVPLAALDDGTKQRRRRLHLECPEHAAPKSPPSFTYETRMNLLGSCDGLLLFERGYYGFTFLVCNPVTRQWIVLPRPSGTMRPCGLYAHRPSGEHRLLYLANDADDDQEAGKTTASHYVLSLGASEPRRLGLASITVEFCTFIPETGHLSYRGNLHWLHHPEVSDTDRILAFDTVSETFRRIPRPPVRDPYFDYHFLLEMDEALAVAAIFNGSMDLWALEDYSNDNGCWTRRLRVDLPSPLMYAEWVMNASVLGPSVILLEDGRVAVLYDLMEKKVLKQINIAKILENSVIVRLTSLVFKDSLQRHAFFDRSN